MWLLQRSLLIPMFCLSIQAVFGQPNRIDYNNQQLFLSGANLAWVNFANDVGSGTTDTTAFGDILLQFHESGGNAMRWWLHTNGVVTPAFDVSGYVVGPGEGTIADIKAVLDLAWDREIGVDLCLWSFDMLRSTNDAVILNRNRLMLTDTAYTSAYVNNCLIPIVQALKGHPAILTWEIFNEPEGMSNEFGWSEIQHVPMSSIQRFINRCAGAIHRTDTSARVTSGAWSFKALTDLPVASMQKPDQESVHLTAAEKQFYAGEIGRKYRLTITPDEILRHLEKTAGTQNYNYYSDSRLIAAGGDLDGTLDFYSVHYYAGVDPSNPTSISPFHHPATAWGLTKPIVVAEFAMQNTIGVPKESLFDTLYQSGYAGALPWSWTDVDFSSHADALAGMFFMWVNFRSAVDVIGSGGHWPTVALTSPASNSIFPDTATVLIAATASDSLGSIVRVEFFVADTVKIGEAVASPYAMAWKNIQPNRYSLSAVATNDQGHKRTSAKVDITVGAPPMTRFEAEEATKVGMGWTARNSAGASGGAFLDFATSDPATSVTWSFNNLQGAGSYPITFGYMLHYDIPKTQHINVNGVWFTDLEFTAPSSTTWYERSINVNMGEGRNTVQMQMYWGWMYVDYLAVPTSILVSTEEAHPPQPAAWVLEQNYPNPFNPETEIRFQVPEQRHVRLGVYDILGREVALLVNEPKLPGIYRVRFDGSNLAAGVYLYRLQAGAFVRTRKLVVLR